MKTSGRQSNLPSIIVVEDNDALAGFYAQTLADKYRVSVAYTGSAALEEIDEGTDVVLLDRWLPGISGDEVLETIRDRGYRCKVAMITANTPDLDIVDMPFDAYVVKPVGADDLCRLVESLLIRSRYGQSVEETMAAVSKIVALESRFDRSHLEEFEEYRELCERKERLESENRRRLARMTDDGSIGFLYREVLKSES